MNLKQVKFSACTASTRAARYALTRSVSRSAAWMLLFFAASLTPVRPDPASLRKFFLKVDQLKIEKGVILSLNRFFFMKKNRFSEAQIITILQQQQSGQIVAHIVHEHGLSEATFYTWKTKYAGLQISVVLPKSWTEKAG